MIVLFGKSVTEQTTAGVALAAYLREIGMSRRIRFGVVGMSSDRRRWAPLSIAPLRAQGVSGPNHRVAPSIRMGCVWRTFFYAAWR